MISIKFPFDIKYSDIFNDECIIINLTDQGGLVSERQCADIAFMLAVKEDTYNILIYNPERINTYRLVQALNQKKEKVNFDVKIEEVLDYEV